MTSPPAGPDFSPPGFAGCYRHPDRSTGIRCQRCSRPICGECTRPASVGFHCPRCVATGRSEVRQPRTRFGAGLSGRTGRATTVVMAALVLVWLVDLVTQVRLASNLLVMSNAEVAGGQLWRLLTASLTSGGLFAVLMNLLVLWLAGRAVESELGVWRFLGLYLTAGLGGATFFLLFGPSVGWAYGASSAVIGLLAANAIGKRKHGEDIRPDLGLLLLIVLYSLLIGFASFGWLMLVGGIAVGALVGVVLAYAPRRNRTPLQVAGLAGVVLLCLVAVGLRLTVG